MYASLKSITTWPPSRENARRFTLLLCTASALGSLLSYGISAPLSLGLLLFVLTFFVLAAARLMLMRLEKKAGN